jgi:hypothetical protein
MTADEFRSLALALPEAVEAEHMNHPDFRVRGKIFSTLGPAPHVWGMVKLTPDQQRDYSRDEPDVFEPCAGVWGKRGATKVNLGPATAVTVREAMIAAWRNTAPKRLADTLPDEE